MTQVYEAVYEQGTFRPLTPPAASFAEGQTMQIVVETVPADDLLSLAAEVYEGLTDEQVRDIEAIATSRFVTAGLPASPGRT